MTTLNKMKLIFMAMVAIGSPIVMAYDEKFDKIDVDAVIADETLFNGYINCFLDKGPCSLEHSDEFKKLLPEVIATACAKCSPPQKRNVRKSITAIQTKKPEEFKIFKEKYDPKGEYEAEFTKFMLASD